MLPETTHDELTEQLFVRDFKNFISGEVEAQQRAAAAVLDPGERHNARTEEVFDRLHELPSFQAWASLRRSGQELLWDVINGSIKRQAGDLAEKARNAPEIGSVTIDPDFVTPDHLAKNDVHLMPGGYQGDDGDVGQ